MSSPDRHLVGLQLLPMPEAPDITFNHALVWQACIETSEYRRSAKKTMMGGTGVVPPIVMTGTSGRETCFREEASPVALDSVCVAGDEHGDIRAAFSQAGAEYCDTGVTGVVQFAKPDNQ